VAEIRWTEESAQWLRDIHDYIAADNPGAAANVVDSIYEKAQLLRDQPEIGCKFQTVSGREVRILLYGHYRTTYLIKN
jgi:plasmid stabilization system protein ParE